MKKNLCLLLAALLVVSAAGCSKKAEAPAKEPETAAATETPSETVTSPETEAAVITETTAAPETAAETLPETSAEKKKPAAESLAKTALPKKEAQTPPLPDDTILLPFADEAAYAPENYPDLSLRGSASEKDADQMMEGISDMLAAEKEVIVNESRYIYGDCTTQVLLPDEEKGARIIDTYICTGNPLLDEVMKKEGYSDYSVDYYYPWYAWVPAGEELNAPVYAELSIDNSQYRYCFSQNELIRREGPDGESLNPETNRFMQSVYKIGCYYGNVAGRERNRYSLFVTSLDNIEEKEDCFVITCQIQGQNGYYSLTADRDTAFSDTCETEFFSGYEEGDTGYDWYARAYHKISSEDPEFDIMALLGVFDVKTTGNHIDELLGCYWWD